MPGSWRPKKESRENLWSLPESSSPAEVHALAHAINVVLGNVGTMVDYMEPVEAIVNRAGVVYRAMRRHGRRQGQYAAAFSVVHRVRRAA